MSTEKFCLRLEERLRVEHLQRLRELREDKDFRTPPSPVTTTRSRRKVILMACSPTSGPFSGGTGTNIRCLPKGVKYSDLVSVLVMYHGEVNVAQEDLNSFHKPWRKTSK